MEENQLWLFKPPQPPPKEARRSVIASMQVPFEFDFDEALCEVRFRLAARRQQVRRRAVKLIADRERQLALSFETRLRRQYPDTGRNSFDWASIESLMHIGLLEDTIEDVRDPSCRWGTPKHTEIWSWIYGTDPEGREPFSFETCCRFSKENPSDVRQLLLPFLVKGRQTNSRRRVSARAIAEAQGFTWEEWRRMQLLYQELCTAVDLARLPPSSTSH